MADYTDMDKSITKAYNKINFRKMVFESVVNSVFLESADDEETANFLKWKQDVQSKHPEKKLLFKGRIEKGSKGDLHTVSAERSGEDQSYGVWDHSERKGHVFNEGVGSGGDGSSYNKWLLAKLDDLPRTKAGYEKGVMEDDSHSIDEGKFLDTHLSSGKPNPSHPAYATHKKAYDNKKSLTKSQDSSPVKLHHIDAAIGNAYPDTEPYELLATKFPELHRQNGKTGSKLMDHLNQVAKNNGAKDFNDYVSKSHKDFNETGIKESTVSRDTLLEYHTSGSVNGKQFKIATDDVYDIDTVKKQNPHLSNGEAHAIVAHTESDDFIDGYNNITSTHGGHTVNTRDSGGYHGDLSNTMHKLGLHEKSNESTVSRDTVLENHYAGYNITGTVNGKEFSVQHNGSVNADVIKKQNDHLSNGECNAIMAQSETPEYIANKVGTGTHGGHEVSILSEEYIAEGDVIQGEFQSKQDKKGKTPYYKNPDIEVPMYDRKIGNTWNQAYSGNNEQEKFDRFESEPASDKVSHIVGITNDNKRVRISTADKRLADVLADAYNRNGFSDHQLQRIKLGEDTDKTDTVAMDIPFLIKIMEYAREEAKSDSDLHIAAEKMAIRSKNGPLTMDSYKDIFDQHHSEEDDKKMQESKTVENLMTKQYPDSKQGVIDMLQASSNKKFFKSLEIGQSHVKIFPDPVAAGVWAVDNPKTKTRVIAYLHGYKTPGGETRHGNDFEEGEIPKREMKQYGFNEEKLDEVLTAATPVGTWIKDFVESDDPKFKDKSKEERRKMAIGAYYGAQKK